MSLPSDVIPGPLDLDELDEFTDFVQRVCLAESGRKYFTREELAHRFSRSGFELGRDTLLLRNREGSLVGAEWVENRSPHVRSQATGFVSPDRTREGIGTALLGWARGQAEARLEEAPPGARVTLQAGVDAGHQPSIDLLVGFGMSLDRYFLEMRTDFEGEIPDPGFPEGLEVRTFRPGEDDAPVSLAIDDAFRDHYGHIERPTDAVMEGFRHWMAMDSFDPTLWWVVLEEGEVIAANLCLPSVEGDEDIGYVGVLGVRKPWRGRGVAQALLRLAFGEFRRRGKKAATLHVDAQNLTGATRLYEAVGMRETERYASFELEIRPGEDLAVR